MQTRNWNKGVSEDRDRNKTTTYSPDYNNEKFRELNFPTIRVYVSVNYFSVAIIFNCERDVLNKRIEEIEELEIGFKGSSCGSMGIIGVEKQFNKDGSDPRTFFSKNPKALNKIKDLFIYLSSLGVPDIWHVFCDILADNQISIPTYQGIPLLCGYFNQEKYDQALELLEILQINRFHNTIYHFSKMLDANLTEGTPLAEGFNIGSFDYSHLAGYYQSITENNAHFKEANSRLYHVYLLSLEGEKLTKKNKEELFRFAVRSGEQQLIDATFNPLCGFVTAKAFVNVQVNEDTLISTANHIEVLTQQKEALIMETKKLKLEIEQLKAKNNSSQTYPYATQPFLLCNENSKQDDADSKCVIEEKKEEEKCSIQ
jgi:hypothetical protein